MLDLGFSLENWKGLPDLCVFFFFFTPLLFWNCQCCESCLAWLPKLASLGQLKAEFNLHSFGKGAPCPEAAFWLCRCLEVVLGLMRCHQGGNKAENIWKNNCARFASSFPGEQDLSKIRLGSAWKFLLPAGDGAASAQTEICIFLV